MPDYTYVNDSLGHKSHRDHYIVSDNVYYTIDRMHVSPNCISLSKHYLIMKITSDSLDQLRGKTAHRAPASVQKVV